MGGRRQAEAGILAAMKRWMVALAGSLALGLAATLSAQSPSPMPVPAGFPLPAGSATSLAPTAPKLQQAVNYTPMTPALQQAVAAYMRLLLDKKATQKSLQDSRAKVEGLLGHSE
jgi:hypothetical protein